MTFTAGLRCSGWLLALLLGAWAPPVRQRTCGWARTSGSGRLLAGMLGVIPVPLGSAVGPGPCTPVLARAPTVVLHTYFGTPEPPEGKGGRNLTQCPVSFQSGKAAGTARVALPEAGVQDRTKALAREVRGREEHVCL